MSGHTIIDFIADRQQAERQILVRGTEIDRLQKHFKEPAASIPPIPGLAAGHRAAQRFLSLGRGKARLGSVECHHLTGAVGKDKQLAADQLPKGCGRILNRCHVPRGHHRL
jgi:hypothetical protein